MAACPTCGGPGEPGHIPTPAEAVALGICWLATWGRDGKGAGVGAVVERMRQRKRHPDKGCRWCPLDQAEKLRRMNVAKQHEGDDPRFAAFLKLSKNQQYARVCEAQEVSWIDSLPA